MDYMPLIMMGLIGLGAGWIASQLVNGGRDDLVNNLVIGVIGAFVGGEIQRFARFDFMKLGNPLLEQLAVATMGAIVIMLVTRGRLSGHRHR